MFTQLVATLTLALLCAASPVIVTDNFVKLPIARRFNSTGAAKLVQLDRARAQTLKASSQSRHSSQHFRNAAKAAVGAMSDEPVTNQATTYTAAVSGLRFGDATHHGYTDTGTHLQVQVGSPPTTCESL